MGIFDKPTSRTLAEIFPPGTPFRLINAWISGQVRSPATGAVRTLAKIEVSPVTDPDNIGEFGVWGSLCDQIRKIEPGELPLIVTLDNSTGLWLFTPHGEPQTVPVEADVSESALPVAEPVTNSESNEEKPRTINAVPEAHLDLDGGDSDNPTPVPPAGIPVGTGIDEGSAEPPPQLPPAARPVGTGIDESQVFDPTGDDG